MFEAASPESSNVKAVVMVKKDVTMKRAIDKIQGFMFGAMSIVFVIGSVRDGQITDFVIALMLAIISFVSFKNVKDE